jgi:hypothetical protein
MVIMNLLSGPFFRLVSQTRRVPVMAFVAGAALLSPACDLGPTHPTVPGPTETFTISGTVLDVTDRRPVEGAEVREEYSRAQTTTDSSGAYTLSGVYGETSSVTVTRPGYLPLRKTLAGGANARLDLDVSRILSYVLSGMVFEVVKGRRTPISGVELFCHGCGSPDGHALAFTDASGLYRFAWAIGPTELNVTREGYRLADATGDESTTTATVNADTRFDIELVRR